MNAYLASNRPASRLPVARPSNTRHPRTGLKSLGELLERLVQVYERQNAQEAARTAASPALTPAAAGTRSDRPASWGGSSTGTGHDWVTEPVAPGRCYQTTFDFFEAGVS
jgi:hypothetical protein